MVAAARNQASCWRYFDFFAAKGLRGTHSKGWDG
jgi:hypothetical protein